MGFLRETDGLSAYYDKGSLFTTSEGNVRVWFGIKKNGKLALKLCSDINCKNKQLTDIGIAFYDEKGNVIGQRFAPTSENPKWLPVLPDHEELLKIVCAEAKLQQEAQLTSKNQFV